MGEYTLGNSTERVTCRYSLPLFSAGSEIPFLVGNRIEIHSPLEEEPAFLCKDRQRILEAVEYLCQKTGTELYGKELSREIDLIPDLYAFRHLIYLEGCDPIGDSDDFPLEPGIAYQDISNLILYYALIELNVDKVSINTYNATRLQ